MKTAICLILLWMTPSVVSEQRTVPRSQALLSVTHVDPFGLLVTAAAAQEPTEGTLTRILTNRALWGKDFGAALSSIPAWNQIGETTVVVFSDRVMENRGHEKRNEAERAAANLTKAMGLPPRQPLPVFRDLLALSQRTQMHAEVLPYADDDFHVYQVASGAQMLNPELTPQALEQILGKPERVRKLSIEGKRDRRGLVLTLYTYAGGKVTFAQADVSSRPGRIDRVFLDVPAVLAALFQEGK